MKDEMEEKGKKDYLGESRNWWFQKICPEPFYTTISDSPLKTKTANYVALNQEQPEIAGMSGVQYIGEAEKVKRTGVIQ